MGPDEAVAGVQRALAMGAHKAVLVTDDALRGADALVTARVLAAAIARQPFDLVLAGAESTDGYTGTVPDHDRRAARHAGVTFARKVDDRRRRVPRRAADRGRLRRGASPPSPALVTVTAGATEPRYPSLKGIMARQVQAGRASSRLADLGLSGDDLAPTQSVGAVDRRAAEGGRARSSRATTAVRRDRRSARRGEGDLTWPTIWVYAEVTPDGPRARALELLTKARSLGDDVAAVALGPGATAAAAELGAHGATTVYASDDAVFRRPARPRGRTHVARADRAHTRRSLILFAGTYEARDVAGRLQALTGSTLMANATDVESPRPGAHRDLRRHEVRRRRARGAGAATRARPPQVVPRRAERRHGDGRAGRRPSSPRARTATVIERHAEAASGPKLEEAKVVIAGGRGLGRSGPVRDAR